MAGLLLLWLASLGCGDAKIDSIVPVGHVLAGSYKTNNYLGAAFNLQWRFRQEHE